MNSLIGSEGMTLVEYQGGNYGTEIYYGKVTGTKYKFSASKNKKMVDNRDLDALLDVVDHGRYMFKKVNEIPTVEPEDLIIDKAVDSKSESVEEITEEKVEESVEGMTHIEAGNVRGIGVKSVEKLREASIHYWEQFIRIPSEDLAEILDVSPEKIDEFKAQLVED